MIRVPQEPYTSTLCTVAPTQVRTSFRILLYESHKKYSLTAVRRYSQLVRTSFDAGMLELCTYECCCTSTTYCIGTRSVTCTVKLQDNMYAALNAISGKSLNSIAKLNAFEKWQFSRRCKAELSSSCAEFMMEADFF